jgi:hypothetical protein
MEAKMVALKSGGVKWVQEMSSEEFVEVTESNEGFCMTCGETASGVEPDAREYVCECCGQPAVYGYEELMLMGEVELTD